MGADQENFCLDMDYGRNPPAKKGKGVARATPLFMETVEGTTESGIFLPCIFRFVGIVRGRFVRAGGKSVLLSQPPTQINRSTALAAERIHRGFP
jgi:hypothetical protein